MLILYCSFSLDLEKYLHLSNFSFDSEQDRLRKMDDGDEIKAGDTELDPSSKNMLPTKGSHACPEHERDDDQRNGVGRNSSRVQKLWNAKMTIFQGKAAYIRLAPVYSQDPCALATIINHITWDTNMSEPFLEVDVKLNLCLETCSFASSATSARLQQLGSTPKAADKLASLFISASKPFIR
ncbi:hypothetical protein J1N35_018632 [Gossypium stocksii]|uniref:Uncharacterized protein n=1 Tax=Gossypium stocksii TaxID=47602 RepID=A0A9D4A796_9ROSI|nr:hypothetical protein J1N35_018632 [Gossypium stocksii]